MVERFKVAGGKVLLALDGTEYFASQKLHCANCSARVTSKGQLRYSHRLVLAALVSPEQREVVALEPAFISPQEHKAPRRDGNDKQDCELAAAKRWLTGQAPSYDLSAIVLGDDLYCHQPFCELLLAQGLDFILVCKPDSHPTLYDYLCLLYTSPSPRDS